MRVALIQPEIPQSEDENLLGIYPPMGLAWLAGNISDEVEIIDLRLTSLTVKDWDVVGISCQTVGLEQCRTLAQQIRAKMPEAVIVTGGHHSVVEDMLTFSDFVVRGEGEITFQELLLHIGKIKRIRESKEAKGIRKLEEYMRTINIPGVSTLFGSSPDRLPAELFRLNSPDYNTLSLAQYHPHEGTMVTSRGCPYHCIFCTRPFGNTWRGRTPCQVVEEAEFLLENGAQTLHIMDDLFTYDKERTLKICEGLASLHITWDLPNGTRVDTVDQDLLNAMAESGCYRILYGIESGVEDILKRIQKQITIEQIERAISMTKKIGIEAEGLFMVGNPGDTPETIRKTVEFIGKLDIKGHFSLATPYPGTDFWRWVVHHGKFLDVPYKDFEQTPVFETLDFSAEERLNMWKWASSCT
ncbi:MAG: radical SAM protein [Theionarchaea archaeon]|nr:radical SAM protein [Theionarchaea archaeon]